MIPLTKRQAEALAAIRRFRSENGYSPTYKDIGEMLGISKVSAFQLVGSLMDRGAVVNTKSNGARCLMPVEENCPHCGKAIR